jgi:hypothetical protein
MSALPTVPRPADRALLPRLARPVARAARPGDGTAPADAVSPSISPSPVIDFINPYNMPFAPAGAE